MKQELSERIFLPSELRLSTHAQKRMSQRSISKQQVYTALEIGRYQWGRNALHVYVGKREIKQFKNKNYLNLLDIEGLHLICSVNGHILTCYRNRKTPNLRV